MGARALDPNRAQAAAWLCFRRLRKSSGSRKSRSASMSEDAFPDQINSIIEHLDVDALCVWQDPQLAARLAASEAGIIFLGGAFLEEEVLMAALRGKQGYDIRLLMDVSVARHEADRPLVLTSARPSRNPRDDNPAGPAGMGRVFLGDQASAAGSGPAQQGASHKLLACGPGFVNRARSTVSAFGVDP